MVVGHVVAVGRDVAVVVVGHRDRGDQLVAVVVRELLALDRPAAHVGVVVRVVAADLQEVGRLGLGLDATTELAAGGVVPARRVVPDLRAHVLHETVGQRPRVRPDRVELQVARPGAGTRAVVLVRAVRVGRALDPVARVRIGRVVAQILVSGLRVRARLDVERLVGPLLARADGEEDVAQTERLHVDTERVLEPCVRRRRVVLGDRYPELLEVVGVEPRELRTGLREDRLRRAAGRHLGAVREADDGHARVARERGVGATRRDAGIGMRHRAAEPAVLHRDREVGHPGHEALAVGRAAVEGRARVAVRLLRADVVHVLDDAVGEQAARPLHLLVLGVVEDRAVVDRMPEVGLDLARARCVLREDRNAADAAVDEPLRDRRVLARDQVVPVEILRVLAHVHDVRERLRVARVVDVLDADDRQVVVGVRAREADRRTVIAPAGPHRVLVELVEVAGRAADAHVVHVVQRLHDRGRVLLRVVVVEAEVEDVLERPHPPVQGRVRGRGVVVRDRERQVPLVDDAARLRVEQLRGPPPEGVLRDVVVVRDAARCSCRRPR